MMLNDLIGVPFINQGRDFKTGLDCYGLVIEVFKRFEIEVPEYYINCEDASGIDTLYKDNTKGYPWRECEPGNKPVPCLIALRFNQAKYVNHTGIYLGKGQFIHIRQKVGSCIDRIDSPAWRRLIAGFYEFCGEQK